MHYKFNLIEVQIHDHPQVLHTPSSKGFEPMTLSWISEGCEFKSHLVPKLAGLEIWNIWKHEQATITKLARSQ